MDWFSASETPQTQEETQVNQEIQTPTTVGDAATATTTETTTEATATNQTSQQTSNTDTLKTTDFFPGGLAKADTEDLKSFIHRAETGELPTEKTDKTSKENLVKIKNRAKKEIQSREQGKKRKRNESSFEPVLTKKKTTQSYHDPSDQERINRLYKLRAVKEKLGEKTNFKDESYANYTIHDLDAEIISKTKTLIEKAGHINYLGADAMEFVASLVETQSAPLLQHQIGYPYLNGYGENIRERREKIATAFNRLLQEYPQMIPHMTAGQEIAYHMGAGAVNTITQNLEKKKKGMPAPEHSSPSFSGYKYIKNKISGLWSSVVGDQLQEKNKQPQPNKQPQNGESTSTSTRVHGSVSSDGSHARDVSSSSGTERNVEQQQQQSEESVGESNGTSEEGSGVSRESQLETENQSS